MMFHNNLYLHYTYPCLICLTILGLQSYFRNYDVLFVQILVGLCTYRVRQL